jgi:hypothetical protein
MPEHIIIFSHGFGVRKDSRGLFDAVAEELKKEEGIDCILFDYSTIDEKKNIITVEPFSKQVAVLQKVIEDAQTKKPDAIIDIIAHSQGCTVAALLNPEGIRKSIFCAPFFHTDIEKIRSRYLKFSQSELNFDGVSKRLRRDGSTTIIPPEYWKERFDINLFKIYNSFAKKTNLIIISANQDEIINEIDYSLLKNCRLINLEGKHDFEGEEKYALIKTIKQIIISD